jgi:hypothetical protein
VESARAGRPKQRKLEAEILTSAGWVRATLVRPELQSLTDYLQTAGPFVKLTDATLPGGEQQVEFLALQRAAVHLVAPVAADAVETEGSGGITSPWRIACIFERGILHGRLDFLVNLRLSDYLRQQTGFIIVRDAAWKPAGAGDAAPSSSPWPVVIVNAARVLGVVEGENPPDAGHPGRLPPSEWED